MPAVLDTAQRRAAATDSPPDHCPDPTCEGKVSWTLHARVSSHAPGDGRLRLNEVVPRVVLICDDCGEPLWVVEDDAELAEFVVAPRPPIVINVVGRRPGKEA